MMKLLSLISFLLLSMFLVPDLAFSIEDGQYKIKSNLIFKTVFAAPSLETEGDNDLEICLNNLYGLLPYNRFRIFRPIFKLAKNIGKPNKIPLTKYSHFLTERWQV